MISLKRHRFDEELDRLLGKAEEIIPAEILPNLPAMECAPDVSDWYEFEGDLWKIGEEIRQCVGEYGLVFNNDQVRRIIKLCLDKRAKRGRQSFVMLLGRKVYHEYADEIIALLNDEDVDGQVIDTVCKMQAGQYVDWIKPFLNHRRTWIRNAAKKYVKKFQ